MGNEIEKTLRQQIKEGVWTGYVTYYPHKKAYRQLEKINFKKEWNVEKLNLYIHIPFCNRKCSYCNLFSTIIKTGSNEDYYSLYVDKVIEEIEFYKDYVNPKTEIMSLYFGGGTPNILPIYLMKKIIDKLKEIFKNWNDNIEICTECSPELLNEEYLKQLKEIGFHRISVGVQTLIPKEIQAINRTSDEEMITNISAWAKKHQVNINFDLIYGLPYQTEETFFISLNKIIDLLPESICCYPLAIREHTPINNNNNKIMFSMKQKYDLFKKIRKHLENKKYSCQTIVRFVRSENSTCQMERYEYEGIPTLGMGAGARSYGKNINYSITYKVQDKFIGPIINEYMSTKAKNRVFDGYKYNNFDHKIKFAMLNLLDMGIDTGKYTKIFKSKVEKDFEEQFEALNNLKLIKYYKTTKTYSLTKKGMQYCDIVANTFVSEEVKKLYKSYISE